jgi:hypothetical protein
MVTQNDSEVRDMAFVHGRYRNVDYSDALYIIEN